MRLSASALLAAAMAMIVILPAAVPRASYAADTPPACPALLNNSYPRLQDEVPQSLCQYAGDRKSVV